MCYSVVKSIFHFPPPNLRHWLSLEFNTSFIRHFPNVIAAKEPTKTNSWKSCRSSVGELSIVCRTIYESSWVWRFETLRPDTGANETSVHLVRMITCPSPLGPTWLYWCRFPKMEFLRVVTTHCPYGLSKPDRREMITEARKQKHENRANSYRRRELSSLNKKGKTKEVR